ncbi:MAG: hypothetical protein ACREOE_04380 [Gemmatimonadales bacterium]
MAPPPAAEMQQSWVPQLQAAVPPSVPVPEPLELEVPPDEELPEDPSSPPPSPPLVTAEPPHAAASARDTKQSEVLFMGKPSLKGSGA